MIVMTEEKLADLVSWLGTFIQTEDDCDTISDEGLADAKRVMQDLVGGPYPDPGDLAADPVRAYHASRELVLERIREEGVRWPCSSPAGN